MGTLHHLPPRSDRGTPRCSECGWKFPKQVYAFKAVTEQFPNLTLYIDCPECGAPLLWVVEFAVPQTKKT